MSNCVVMSMVCVFVYLSCVQVQHRAEQTPKRIHSFSTVIFMIRVSDIVRTSLFSTLYAKLLNPQIVSPRRWQL
jgi:hypothetical protein